MTAAPRSTESFSYAPTRSRLRHAPFAVSPRRRPGGAALRGDQAGLVRVDHGPPGLAAPWTTDRRRLHGAHRRV